MTLTPKSSLRRQIKCIIGKAELNPLSYPLNRALDDILHLFELSMKRVIGRDEKEERLMPEDFYVEGFPSREIFFRNKLRNELRLALKKLVGKV